MDYKKLVSLLALSTLALAACDTADEEPSPEPQIEDGAVDDAETDTDTDTDTDGADSDSADSSQDPHSLIDSIQGSDLDYTSDVELEITGGTWTQQGYTFTPEDGEATVEGSAAGEGDIFAYVLQDGVVVEMPEVDAGAFTFTAPAEDGDTEYQVGVSDEELWAVGDEADPTELDRVENVIILAPAAE
ncbi:hypothetical protein [Alkalibacterium sp. MB6]|uniref:hypothetical protein n=1 Tax=Alkalibacterium sp. MB6 TaxID=2081965 RepID=UPI00137A3080|nr:hypothetical protein [Alkalibacterium sp. MB6]